jgi:hypothetical protein
LIRGQSLAVQSAIAASSRSTACRLGFWTDQPKDFSRVGRYRELYVTPNSRWINSATSRPVQSCPERPAASGPADKSFSRRRFCRLSSFGVAPGAVRVLRAWGRRPCSDLRTQSCTERIEHPIAAAARAAVHPSLQTRRTARARTSSGYGSLPCVLIPTVKQIHSFTKISI